MLKKTKTERLIWIDIMITLIALELMACFYYGLRALVLGGVCIAVSLAAELISLRLMRRRFTADDLTCTSDALITALMMPAVIEYKIPAMACVFAVIVAKNIFGGRVNMIFSPAAVAYLFIMTSWKKELLSYPQTYEKIGVLEHTGNLVSSASYAFNNTGTMSASDFEILLGSFIGPMGAVCILLLLVSAVVLIFRKDISFGAFAGTILGTGFMAYLCPVTGSRADSVKYVLATNMILFAAVYIISDLRIAPRKNYYAFFYGFFISVSSYVIMLTTGKENVIVIMSVLFTPVSLAFKNLQKRIDTAARIETEMPAEAKEITVANDTAAEVFENEEEAPDDDIEEISEKAIAEIAAISGTEGLGEAHDVPESENTCEEVIDSQGSGSGAEKGNPEGDDSGE